MAEAVHVAVVDDDEAVRASTLRLLARAGYRADAYADGESFLRDAGHRRYDAILLDVRMPGMDGLAVLRALEVPAGFATPVIVMTGHGDVPLAVEAMKLGAQDFIEKPYRPETLFDAIRLAVDTAAGDPA